MNKKYIIWGCGCAFILFIVAIMMIAAGGAKLMKNIPSGNIPSQVTTPDTTDVFQDNDESQIFDEDINTDEAIYLMEVAQIGANLEESFLVIGELSDDPLKVYTDETYKLEISSAMIVIQDQYTNAQAMNPPAKYVPLHNKLLTALQKYDEATGYFTSGVDDMDPDAITTASNLLNEGNTILLEVVDDIDAMNSQ